MNKNERIPISPDRQALYRRIPKVDVLLVSDKIKTLTGEYGHEAVMSVIREETDRLRSLIRTSDDTERIDEEIRFLPESISHILRKRLTPGLKKVVNGTGVILHTSLGRAPLSYEHAMKTAEIVSGYSNLEYDTESGGRGDRNRRIEDLLIKLTGAEAALAVNNNAAAVLLILSAVAKGGEVIVSRGELVEIGGRFRIPDVLEQSGALLREIGTTNKTHPEDYRSAVSDRTKAILKVHTSNYRIIGFTESVGTDELKKIACEYNLPVIEDLGSGVLSDLEQYGISHEPTVKEAVAQGADVISFSGDKLLGGPQCGIILGKKQYIDLIKKHPLARAVRVDKFTAVSLEMTLLEYLHPETLAERIPVLGMISESKESTKKRAERLAAMIREASGSLSVGVMDTFSRIGGGALPLETIESTAVVIRPDHMGTAMLEEILRKSEIPVIGRSMEDAFWLDVRTIPDRDFDAAVRMIADAVRSV